MKLGSLFSGGGLGDFGFMAAGMEISWQCEIDEYCQKILALRYPESKKYYDIKKLKGSELEPINIITGGFPCQPFSVAGKQMGVADNRNLWPEMRRIISETNPSWVVCENVPGIIPIYLDVVYSDLAAAGYEVMPFVFSAHSLGAKHRRERLWIVANSGHYVRDLIQEPGDNGPAGQYSPQGKDKRRELAGSSGRQGRDPHLANPTDAGIKGMCERKEPAIKDVADTRCGTKRTKKHGFSNERINSEAERFGAVKGDRFTNSGEIIWRKFWESEPSVGRVANGIADRVHRLKMLGNGQVPSCTYVIGKMIMEIENTRTPEREA